MHTLALVKEPGSLLEQREEEPLKGREALGTSPGCPTTDLPSQEISVSNGGLSQASRPGLPSLSPAC